MTSHDAYFETDQPLTDDLYEDETFGLIDRRWVPAPESRRSITPEPLATNWRSRHESPIQAIEDSVLREKLFLRKFSLLSPPEQPAALLTLGSSVILTPGNLANIQAQAKAGKSAVLGGILAAALDSMRGDLNRISGDYLGFNGGEQSRGLILHLDTEQSRYDHHQCVRRALHRADMTQEPDNFLSYSLVDLSVEERKRALCLALDEGVRLFGGVHLVAIDGVGDLLVDSNDLAVSFELVDWLHKTAVLFNCGIVTVLHENPGDGGGKARGHLGSQLERKAESNVLVRKETSGISKIWCERGRHCYIPKSEAHLFAWDEEARMHRSVDPVAVPDRYVIAHQEAVKAIAKITMPLSYTALFRAIRARTGVKERTAKDRIRQWGEMDLICKGEDELYYSLVQGADGAEEVQDQ